MKPTTPFARLSAAAAERFGVLGSWASWARVGVWLVVWVVVLGAVMSPRLTTPADRDLVADDPPSNVEYLGPTSRQDFAGYLPATDTRDSFNVAWIGGSELKLREVSVPGAVSQQFSAFADEPVQHRVYTVIGPRPIDALRGVDRAIADGADAIVISANPVWATDEWSMQGWPNLDVAQLGTLWRRPALWPWAVALTSPADVGWSVMRRLSPVVEAQSLYNERVQPELDRLDIIDDPPVDTSPPDPPTEDELRLPADATSFWLAHHAGTDVFDAASIKRVTAMMNGMDDDQPVARSFADELVGTAVDADVPVYLYIAPFSPEALADPELVAALDRAYDFWGRVDAGFDSDLVLIDLEQMTPEFADRAGYFDAVHMFDPFPFAEVLAPKLCDHWAMALEEACE